MPASRSSRILKRIVSSSRLLVFSGVGGFRKLVLLVGCMTLTWSLLALIPLTGGEFSGFGRGGEPEWVAGD